MRQLKFLLSNSCRRIGLVKRLIFIREQLERKRLSHLQYKGNKHMIAIPILAMDFCAGTLSYPQMQGTVSY